MEEIQNIKKNVNSLISLTKQEKWEEIPKVIEDLRKSYKKAVPPPKPVKEEGPKEKVP
jgi:hypothetical protein